MMTTPDLCPGYVKINVAEFLALLITRETFTPFCEGKITSLWVYNVSARAWFDRARCPRYPFDRCAQGFQLWMLKNSMKIKTVWVSSAENYIADRCSRKTFQLKASGHDILGARYRKIAPKWSNVIRFLEKGPFLGP